MRGFAAALFVLFTLVPPAAAQAPLGDRLGDEISRAERDYFGLFPTVAATFESAAPVRYDNRVEVVVRRTGAADTTLLVDLEAAASLRRFAETFEREPSVIVHPSWQVASGPGAARRLDPGAVVPYVDPGARVRLTVGDRRVEGVVLAASDTLVLLHPLGQPYRWDRTPVARVRPADVTLVELNPQGSERYRRGALLIGALVGVGVAGADLFLLDGGAGSVPVFVAAAAAGAAVADRLAARAPSPGTFAERLPDLRSRAAFRLRIPIDFRPTAGPTDAFDGGAARGSASGQRFARWRRDYGLVNVAVVGGPGYDFEVDQTYTEFFRTQAPSDQTSAVLTSAFDLDLGLDVAVRPVPWVRAGATWTRSTATAVDVTDEEVAVVTPGALRGYVELVAPTPRVGGFGIDVAVGGGLERNTVAVRGQPFRGDDQTVEYDISESSSNGFLQASIELVTPRRTSFFVRLTSRSLPPVAVPGAEVESARFPGVVVYRLDAHEVAFEGYREVSWGTRFRL